MELKFSAKPRPRDCFKIADFSFWCYDPQATKLKAIIVCTPGSGDNGARMMKDWEEFAIKHRCGIIGSYLTDVEPKLDEDYIDAKNGSGRALLEAVDFFTKEGKLPKKLPLLLWGFSAGGEFNYEMACWAPDRVGAFVVNKGGIYYTALAPLATRAIPALFCIGELDAPYRIKSIEGIYTMNKVSGGCRWSLIIQRRCNHWIGNSDRLAQVLFAEVLNDNIS